MLNKIICAARASLAGYLLSLCAVLYPLTVESYQRGIYITQSTAENDKKFQQLIAQSKRVGINTFVIDYTRYNKRYHRNVQSLDQQGIRHVARIVMFPDGARGNQMTDPKYWQGKYPLIQQIAKMGADAIQLDYIRYEAGRRASSQNARDVLKVISWYKERVNALGLPMEIDVFGVAAHAPSLSIGQNLPLFAGQIDTVCPMLYPSHYEPYRHHATRPYETVHGSLTKMKRQFNGSPPFKVVTYIELSNYRYPMSFSSRLNYIKAQLQAVKDHALDGWYAWSPRNQYNALFRLLESNPSL